MPEIRVTSVEQITALPEDRIVIKSSNDAWWIELEPDRYYRVRYVVDGKNYERELHSGSDGICEMDST